MKERIVEDWLTRINERGYQAGFGQILSANGHKILRISHGPYEHGKDVLSIDYEGTVNAYQLKDGDVSLKEWEKCYSQVCALVETRPVHPSLPKNYIYQPYFVTSGILSDPALDRIKQHNESWRQRGFPTLQIHDLRWLQTEFVKLANDFWPVESPDVRLFRSLYLVDGRGDFDADSFTRFIRNLLPHAGTRTEMERRSAAANIFCSYLLGEFYKQEDHWSIFRGWIMTAAAIAAAQENGTIKSSKIDASFELARNAAEKALADLALECSKPDAFRPQGLEWDEYTRLRNTIALSGWAVHCLLNNFDSDSRDHCVKILKEFIENGRTGWWGESAFSSCCVTIWLLEEVGETELSEEHLVQWIVGIAINQSPSGQNPLADPYTTPSDFLKELADSCIDPYPKKTEMIRSYSLLVSVLMLVRRGHRGLLNNFWKRLSYVTCSEFAPANPTAYLDWRSRDGEERDFVFERPQSFSELEKLALAPPTHLLPKTLREDWRFKLMFTLVFPHRLNWSIFGSLDHQFLREGESSSSC